MKLFERIPDEFFSILISSKKELYVEVLFVLCQAFKTELVIRRENLTAMLMDSLEVDPPLCEEDFKEQAMRIQSPAYRNTLKEMEKDEDYKEFWAVL